MKKLISKLPFLLVLLAFVMLVAACVSMNRRPATVQEPQKDIMVADQKETPLALMDSSPAPANENVTTRTEEFKLKAPALTNGAVMMAPPTMYYMASSPISNGFANNEEPSESYESYSGISENEFKEAKKEPVSTFSIDVDAASYSNIRRFLDAGQMPPQDAVRVEEMINYFDYDYPQPKGGDPFSINMEVASCPWAPTHKLVHVGLQGLKMDVQNLPPSNLVFLIDVSGSMQEVNKLPLVQKSLEMLVNQMRKEDRISLVVYAGAAGLVLPSTPGSDKATIMNAINSLEAGGSTAGGEGIELAYKVAKENMTPGSNSRVILATDGDFNVGASSDEDMEKLITEKRKDGIYLTVLGFGMGNYKDSKMEILADKGNGNYAYIDNLNEAKKVLVNEMGATLMTIAKDVKIQVEFNPAVVQSYRLVGYENRLLNKEDFDDDTKDAGEIGAGHTVTALYEIVPVGVQEQGNNQNQPQIGVPTKAGQNLMTIKFRYKKPGTETSLLITKTLKDGSNSWQKSSNDFRFSASVASFGMLLRDSKFKGTATYAQTLGLAKGSLGTDEQGYRAEFIKLVETASGLAGVTAK